MFMNLRILQYLKYMKKHLALLITKSIVLLTEQLLRLLLSFKNFWSLTHGFLKKKSGALEWQVSSRLFLQSYSSHIHYIPSISTVTTIFFWSSEKSITTYYPFPS